MRRLISNARLRSALPTLRTSISLDLKRQRPHGSPRVLLVHTSPQSQHVLAGPAEEQLDIQTIERDDPSVPAPPAPNFPYKYSVPSSVAELPPRALMEPRRPHSSLAELLVSVRSVLDFALDEMDHLHQHEKALRQYLDRCCTDLLLLTDGGGSALAGARDCLSLMELLLPLTDVRNLRPMVLKMVHCLLEQRSSWKELTEILTTARELRLLPQSTNNSSRSTALLQVAFFLGKHGHLQTIRALWHGEGRGKEGKSWKRKTGEGLGVWELRSAIMGLILSSLPFEAEQLLLEMLKHDPRVVNGRSGVALQSALEDIIALYVREGRREEAVSILLRAEQEGLRALPSTLAKYLWSHPLDEWKQRQFFRWFRAHNIRVTHESFQRELVHQISVSAPSREQGITALDLVEENITLPPALREEGEAALEKKERDDKEMWERAKEGDLRGIQQLLVPLLAAEEWERVHILLRRLWQLCPPPNAGILSLLSCHPKGRSFPSFASLPLWLQIYEKEKGVDPISIVEQCANRGQVDIAMVVLEEAEKSYVCSSPSLVSSLAPDRYLQAIKVLGKALSEREDWESILLLFRHLRGIKIHPDLEFSLLVLRAYCARQDFQSARNLMKIANKELDSLESPRGQIGETAPPADQIAVERASKGREILQMMYDLYIYERGRRLVNMERRLSEDSLQSLDWLPLALQAMKRRQLSSQQPLLSLLRCLCQEARMKEAEKIVELYNEYNPPMPSSALLFVYEGHLRSGRPDKAKALLGYMEATGRALTGEDYLRILMALAEEGDPLEVSEVLQQMRTKGFSPGTQESNCLLKVTGKYGFYSDMLKVFGRMEKKKEIDATSFAYVIEGVARSGNDQVLLQIWKQMLAAPIEPKSSSYRPVLASATRTGNLDVAGDLLRKMMQSQIASEGDLDKVLLAAAKTGQWERVEPLVELGREFGHHPSLRTIRKLAGSCREQGVRLSLFPAVFDLEKKYGSPPSPFA